MTIEEAQTLASIAVTVDGGCSVCVGNIVDALNDAFPDFVWVFNEWKVSDAGTYIPRSVTVSAAITQEIE